MKKISIIIPVYNEEENIQKLLPRIIEATQSIPREIIVVDGGSSDQTVGRATALGATVLRSPKKGRAQQMNYGHENSTGDVLYFVHADTLPPLSFVADIRAALAEGYPLGCYRFEFNSPRKILKLNAYFTRFDKMWCRGGDQTLFVTRALFKDLEGYCPKHYIMEEYDFIARARKSHDFKIIPKAVLVSARKYEDNGYLKVQLANLIVFNMYRFGVSQKKMLKFYRSMLFKD